ncbi:hypothetical protein ABIB17_001531 [Arthrobacter sp. UYEF6]
MHDSTALQLGAWLKVLVDGLAADPEFPGECGFRLAGNGTSHQVGRLPGFQRFAPAFVYAGFLG